MKILLVNKFHYLKGGSEKYYFELADLLVKNGHEVAFFSMKDEKNIKTNYKEYFVDNIDMNSKNIFKAFDVIYSKSNKKKMKEVLEDFRPDIVHLNNFQRQLTASIIDAIKEKNIPIVFTAHDLQSVCPASAMLNKGKICEKCIGGHYSNCIKNKCVKDSYLKSFLSMMEAYYYRNKKVYEKIDMIIAPSDFVKNKIMSDHININKICTIHNFIDIKKYEKYEIKYEQFALFCGRLSIEKGILNLLKAFQKTNEGKLYIAGDGPERENIIKFIEENKINDRVKILGFLSQVELKEYLKKCSFLVQPSIWYENCPYSIIEAFAMGKPVVSTNIGGIPELVKNGRNGQLYEYSNISDLAYIMQKLFKDQEYTKRLGKNAKLDALSLYDKETYYNKLIKIYEKLISKEGAANEPNIK